MAKTVEELEKMYTELDQRQKDTDLKLESAERDAKHYKQLAQTREQELQKFKEQVEQSEKDRKEALSKARDAEVSEFVESKTKAGIIIPAAKEKISKFMRSLDAEKTVVEFSEGDGSKKSHSQLSLFKEIISSMKPVIELGTERSFSDTTGADTPDGVEGDEPQFQEVRTEGVIKKLPLSDVDLHLKALEYQENQRKIGKSVEYSDALLHVSPKRKISQVR